MIILASTILALSLGNPLASHFACKDQGQGKFRPYWLQAVDGGIRLKDWSLTPKGLLGQNPMTARSECEQALANANDAFGVVCSRTGLDGWKPTLYTGTVPGRADFGYLGGSSIVQFADCLASTKASSPKGVCFWGGSDWYVSPIDREGVAAGPYRNLADCTAYTVTTD